MKAEPQTPLRLASLKINETSGPVIMVILKISEMDTIAAVDSFRIAAVQPNSDEEPEFLTLAATDEMGDIECSVKYLVDLYFGASGFVQI